jgi:hypothetical protein
MKEAEIHILEQGEEVPSHLYRNQRPLNLDTIGVREYHYQDNSSSS